MDIEKSICLKQLEFIKNFMREWKEEGQILKYEGKATKEEELMTNKSLETFDEKGVRVAYFKFICDEMPIIIRHRLKLE